MFYKIVRKIASFILRIVYSIRIEGKENFNNLRGGAILCANHSTNLDPALVVISSPRAVRFMAKSELFKNVFTNYLYGKLLGAFPIKRGENDLKAMKTAINIVKDGHILGLFPEGTRNKDGHDIDIKAGIGFIVAKTKVPVIPISIHGKTRIFSKIKIIIGEPIDFTKFFQEKISANEYKEISNIIMSKVRGSYHLTEKSLIE